MNDKVIASYLQKDGSTSEFLPHLENSKTAHWDSQTGLTLSGNGREQFFPSHRILEVNRFTEPEKFVWYSLQEDPVIEQFYEGDLSDLKEIVMESLAEFESASFEEIKKWMQQNHQIENEPVIGSLARIALSSSKIQGEKEESGSLSSTESSQEIKA